MARESESRAGILYPLAAQSSAFVGLHQARGEALLGFRSSGRVGKLRKKRYLALTKEELDT